MDQISGRTSAETIISDESTDVSGFVLPAGQVEGAVDRASLVETVQLQQSGETGTLSVRTVFGDVFVVRVDGTQGPLGTGERVGPGDIILTRGDGAVELVTADGAAAFFDSDSRILLEAPEEPGAREPQFFIIQGQFAVDNTGASNGGADVLFVRTPVANLTVRGARVIGKAAPEAQANTFVLLPSTSGLAAGSVAVATAGAVLVLDQPLQGMEVLSMFRQPTPLSDIDIDVLLGAFAPGVLAYTDLGDLPEAPEAEDTGVLTQIRAALGLDDDGEIEIAAGEEIGDTAAEEEVIGSVGDDDLDDRQDDDEQFDDGDNGNNGIITFDGAQTFNIAQGDATLIGGAGTDTLTVIADADQPNVVTGETVNGQAVLNFDVEGTATQVTMQDIEELEVDLGLASDQVVLGNLAGSGILDNTIVIRSGDGGDLLDGSQSGLALELFGGSGNDTLTGGTSADLLDGGSGANTLTGGGGNDTLTGADGIDRAVFAGDIAGFQVAVDDVTGDLTLTDTVGAEGTDTLRASIDQIDFNGALFDIVQGDAGANSLTGDAGNNILAGRAGDDTLSGGEGNDFLTGGSGTDTAIFAGVAPGFLANVSADGQTVVLQDTLGSEGTDTLSADIEILEFGGTGLNTTFGTGGGDTLLQDNGGAVAVGGDGNDTIIGGDGSDVQFGGAGQDSLSGGAGGDTLLGEAGDDTLTGGSGDDVFSGGSGTDLAVFISAIGDVVGSALSDGSGFTIVTAAEGSDTIGSDVEQVTFAAETFDLSIATDNAENLTLGDGNDIHAALGGNDTISAGAGRDAVLAGDGNDNVSGNAGQDTLLGEAGNDTLTGGVGNDVLSGGDGAADRVVYAGAVGDFTFSANDDGSAITVTDTVTGDVDEGTDQLDGTFEEAQFSGETLALTAGNAGDDSLAAANVRSIIFGGGGTDTVTGGTAADLLFGGAGTDSVSGGAGADLVSGDAGNDTLAGGTGNDTLSGGGGTDRVLIADNALANAGDLARTVEVAPISDGSGVTVTQVGTGEVDTLFADVEEAAFDDALFSLQLLDDTANNQAAQATNDMVLGQGGNDTLAGGDGTDFLRGDDGDDSLSGDAGNDTLAGNAGDDTLAGGDGDDRFRFDASDSGTNQVAGGDGADDEINLLLDDAAGTAVTVAATGSDVTIQTTTGATVQTITGDAAVERLGISGSEGNDTLTVGDLAATGIGNRNLQADLQGGNDSFDGRDATTGIRVRGLAGDDTLRGGAGNDTLDGGNQNTGGGDVVTYDHLTADVLVDLSTRFAFSLASGTDVLDRLETVIGGAGNDTLTGDDSSNRLVGNAGNDSLTGNLGDDTLAGEAGNDVLNGGDGIDVADYSAIGAEDLTITVTDATVTTAAFGTDTLTSIEGIFGGAGNDVLTGDGNTNRMNGGAGNDTISTLGNNDTVIGSTGNDLLDAGDGTDTVDYSAISGGGVTLDLAQGTAVVTGISNDTISGFENVIGTNQSDNIFGDDADSRIEARGGDDFVDGGNGIDDILGEDGNDTLTGGDGADSLRGGFGQDSINGDNGNDFIQSEQDNDTVSGDAGDDTISGGSGADLVDGGTGADSLNGDAGNDTVRGGDGNDIVTALSGQNSLQGDAGDDTIIGGDNIDEIFGGIGSDELTGNAGNDRFRYDTQAEAGDLITDFTTGSDKFLIESGGFANVGGGATTLTDGQNFVSQAFDLTNNPGGVELGTSEATFFFDESDSRLHFDPDGGNSANSFEIARLSSGSVQAGDFEIQ
jgi:Ca2+-binding RTX toxin-like protein